MKNISFKAIRAGALVISVLFCQTQYAQIKKIWALGDGEKVFRNDANHPDKNGNLVWDGKTIRLKGLFNEVLAFQVIVETGIEGAKNVEVALDIPVHQQSHKTVGGNTLKYGDGGTIEIFSEHYLPVTDSTHPNWFYGSPAARPAKMTGYIPDALIPSDAMKGRGGFPLDISPLDTSRPLLHGATLQNQGFWVDVYLPRNEKNFPSGIYKGNVQVLQNGNVITVIPLEITLLPYYLPDDNQSTIWLFNDEIYNYFPGLPQTQVENMIKFEAHRHRIDMSGGFKVNQTPFNETDMSAYKAYLDGSAFTPANGYYGPGQGIGEKLFPIGMYGGKVMGNNKADIQKQSDLWVNWFQQNAPRVKYFWYIIDEPSEKVYPWLRERSGWIKSNAGAGKSLPVFTTTAYRQELSGVIDMWAGYDGVDLKKLADIKRSGGDHWFYNGNRPRYGSVILEGEAVDFRVNSWILYKYDIGTWFIWHGTHWQHNLQGPKRHLHQNIFRNPLTFINDDLEFGNGDGILFYPGHSPFYPEEDRGLNRLMPSIRLQNIRRGQQDAAIMKMAEKKAGREKVISLINRIVPKALSEVDMKDPVPWAQRGNQYDRVREELLKLL